MGLQMCVKKKADLSQVYELHGVTVLCPRQGDDVLMRHPPHCF